MDATVVNGDIATVNGIPSAKEEADPVGKSRESQRSRVHVRRKSSITRTRQQLENRRQERRDSKVCFKEGEGLIESCPARSPSREGKFDILSLSLKHHCVWLSCGLYTSIFWWPRKSERLRFEQFVLGQFLVQPWCTWWPSDSGLLCLASIGTPMESLSDHARMSKFAFGETFCPTFSLGMKADFCRYQRKAVVHYWPEAFALKWRWPVSRLLSR